jgi:hypothetical protein
MTASGVPIASKEEELMDRLECDRMFVAVVEARSFTGAAVKLGTSSGQASKLVSRLEAELGVRLLNRTTRAVSETEAGRAYFERIRAVLDEIDNLDLAIRNVAQNPRGRLRLTAPLTFGTVELARALNVFAAGYPEIELDVSFSRTSSPFPPISRSMPSPPNMVSSPLPPLSVSSPTPPWTMSSPLAAMTLSLPAPASMKSAADVPNMKSLKAPPGMVAISPLLSGSLAPHASGEGCKQEVNSISGCISHLQQALLDSVLLS